MKNADDELYSLAYSSHSTLDGDASEIEADVGRILDSARRNNQRLNVTGMLLFAEGSFAQVLEGRRAAVEEIFEAIECDERHDAVTVLYFHPIEERSLASWDMAYVGPDAARRNGLTESPVSQPPGPGRDILTVLLDQLCRAEMASDHPTTSSRRH